jgi:hypothetical protein
MTKQKDLGLLVFRGAGLLLALTFGVQKVGCYWSALHAGKSFSSIGLAPLIAKIGLADYALNCAGVRECISRPNSG